MGLRASLAQGCGGSKAGCDDGVIRPRYVPDEGIPLGIFSSKSAQPIANKWLSIFLQTKSMQLNENKATAADTACERERDRCGVALGLRITTRGDVEAVERGAWDNFSSFAKRRSAWN